LLVGQTIAITKFLTGSAPAGWAKSIWATDITGWRARDLKLLPMRFTGDAERLGRFQQEARP